MTINIDLFTGWEMDEVPAVKIETRYLKQTRVVHTSYYFTDGDGQELNIQLYDSSRAAQQACDDMYYTWGVVR